MDNLYTSKLQGIYIHIPFCDSICPYCDFAVFKSDHQTLFQQCVKAICDELSLKYRFLDQSKHISSIYFGGGTPSLLNSSQINEIITSIRKYFTFSHDIEITFEANPKHLSCQSIENYLNIGINRLSIGIQSFQDDHLKFLGRTHTFKDIENLICNILPSFDALNWSLDIIFGIKNQTLSDLHRDLAFAVSALPKHISAYALTIEQQSLFGKLEQKKGFVFSASSDVQAECFEYIQSFLKSSHYYQYEVSNYALSDYHSRHNSLYWHGGQYLGLGPGAWSFLFDSHSHTAIRAGNPRHIKHYLSYSTHIYKIYDNIICHGNNNFSSSLWYEKEILNVWQIFIERIYLALRTKKGIFLNRLKYELALTDQTWIDWINEILTCYIEQELLENAQPLHFAPTQKGFRFADIFAKKMLEFWNKSPYEVV